MRGLHTFPSSVRPSQAATSRASAKCGGQEGIFMRNALNGAIVALGIAGAALAVSSPASAQIGVGVNVGGIGIGVGVGPTDVAFGYQDGYWDNGHRWHHWRNEQQMRDYRNAPNNKYNDWKHDRDSDHGWHS
jgi:hypothetical protein